MTFTLFLTGYYFLYRRSISILFQISSLLLLVLAGTISEISTRRTNELITYNLTDRYAVGIRTGKTLNVYSDSTGSGIEIARHSAMRRLKVKINQTGRENCLYNAGGNRIMIGSILNPGIAEMVTPDIVVMTGARPRIERNPDFFKNPSELIFTSARPGYVKIALKDPISRVDTVHFVKESGAYVSSLKSKSNKNLKKVEY
jgi:hypothetical protein